MLCARFTHSIDHSRILCSLIWVCVLFFNSFEKFIYTFRSVWFKRCVSTQQQHEREREKEKKWVDLLRQFLCLCTRLHHTSILYAHRAKDLRLSARGKKLIHMWFSVCVRVMESYDNRCKSNLKQRKNTDSIVKSSQCAVAKAHKNWLVVCLSVYIIAFLYSSLLLSFTQSLSIIELYKWNNEIFHYVTLMFIFILIFFLFKRFVCSIPFNGAWFYSLSALSSMIHKKIGWKTRRWKILRLKFCLTDAGDEGEKGKKVRIIWTNHDWTTLIECIEEKNQQHSGKQQCNRNSHKMHNSDFEPFRCISSFCY